MKSYDEFDNLCQKNNTSPFAIAKETGISPSTLSDWKNKRSKPKLEKLILIARHFDVPVETFADF